MARGRLARLTAFRRAERGRRRAAARRAAGRPARARPTREGERPRFAWLLTGVLTVVEALRSGLSWARGLLVPLPRRVLPLPPPEEFLVVGHRGAAAKEVENTVAAFDRAVADGANAIETDLCVTADGEVVVWHDWDPDETVAFARAAGAEFDVAYRPVPPAEGPMRRPVHELTLAQLRAHYDYAPMEGDRTVGATLPTLDDVVRWAAGKGSALACVLLDVKIPAAQRACARTLVAALDAAVARHRPTCRFVLMSPVVEVTQDLREWAPRASRSFDVEIKPGLAPDADDTDPRYAPYSAVRWAVRQGNDHASIGRPRFTLGGWALYTRTVRRDLGEIALHRAHPAHPAPERLVCWTIDRPREMRWLLRLGVHGILTDDPARLRAEYERERARDA
ncbi:MAG: hypothetical protein IT460_06490 [Planctomycetes bacterium]|nr:hypothetical protein [Planctomycetota bacterium]